MNPVCSCGCIAPHVVAKRRTLDDTRVSFWSDGLVTVGMGFAVRGIGCARSGYATAYDLEANRLLMDDMGLFEAAELARAIKLARKLARQSGYFTEAARRARFWQLWRGHAGS